MLTTFELNSVDMDTRKEIVATDAKIIREAHKNDIQNLVLARAILTQPLLALGKLANDLFGFKTSCQSLDAGMAKGALHGTAHL